LWGGIFACKLSLMITKLSRRIILILSVLALSSNTCVGAGIKHGVPQKAGYGFAGAFKELSSGYSRAAVLSVPIPSVADKDSRGGGSGHYLELSELDLSPVPAAPAAGSAQDRADMKTLFDWQDRRTDEQCEQAGAEMKHSYDVLFGRISPFVSPQPKSVARFFKNAAEDSVAAHKYLKGVYQRPRPFLRDSRLSPCIARVDGFSYPSGHATMARLFALILSDLVPARRAEFMARADEAALNRVISGVHHPTDIAAGKTLAEVLYKELLRQPSFKDDMGALRAYLH